jgi:hypothetical protein
MKLGERKSVRAIAQQRPNGNYGCRVKQNSKTKVKIVPGREKTKAKARVPVTALIAWAAFHS